MVNIKGIWEYDANYDDLSYENDNVGSFLQGTPHFQKKTFGFCRWKVIV